MPSHTDTPEWHDIISKPRRLADTVQRAEVPSAPGVYAWFRDDECTYLGKASDLRSRLASHLSSSLDLSRSTLRSWVAVRELGFAREITRCRPTAMTGEQVGIVNDWIKTCELAWTTTSTKEEAATLESCLLRLWRPPINGESRRLPEHGCRGRDG